MPTVAEILKSSGLTDEQIAALDAKAMTAFTGVLTTAEDERKAAMEASKKAEEERVAAKAAQDAAELAQRANKEFYDSTIMPSLTGWEDKEKTLQTEVANAKALAAFYEAQNKAAKEAGFVAADAPKFEIPAVPVAPRDPSGKFVANAPGSTPGSPTFTIEQVKDGLGSTLGTLTDIQWKYQRLYGQPMPVAPTELVRQAEAQKMNPSDYAAKTFNFQQKEQELVERQKAEERAKIVAEATAPLQEQLKAKDAEWQKRLEEESKKISERGGNNPDVRRAAISNYPEVKKAVQDGTRKDPLSMTREERQVEMRRQIQADVTSNEEAKAGAAA
jgi:hypothetical protein